MAVRLREHQRQAHPDRGQADRARHVTAGAEHDVRAAAFQDAAGGSDRKPEEPHPAHEHGGRDQVERADCEVVGGERHRPRILSGC